MSQTTPLVTTLKRELKAHGITYADVALHLELSEASVKRLFSEKNFTLQRLESICSLINIELSDLVLKMQQDQPRLSQLSHEQEKEITEDLLLLLVAVSVINGMSYEDILQLYDIAPTDCLRKLVKLDKLQLIELLPGNRIKLRVAPNFSWRPNGPIQRFFHQKVEQDFFNSRFEKSTEKLVVCNALLSDTANARIQKKMDKLSKEFNELMQDDLNTPMNKKHGTTMVLAIRQWQYGLFKQLTK